MRRIFIWLLIVNVVFLSSTSVPAQVSPEYTRLLEAKTWSDSLMETMSLREKIGQMIMVAAYSNRDSQHLKDLEKLIAQDHVGGVIFFQGSPVAQAQMQNRLQALSRIPLWIAMDGEWGLGMRLDSTMKFPFQMTLGAIQNNALIEQMGSAIARQFQRLGMQVNFAPVLDVNNNPLNPVINFRSFGEDRINVAIKGAAYVAGMQSEGLVVTGKHFPGHGDTDTDSHLDLPIIGHSLARLDSVELYPFKTAIEEGLTGVMVAHLRIPSIDPLLNVPTTLSENTINLLLKQRLKFKGLVFTDALNMKGVTKLFAPGEIEVMAIKAGNDVLLFPEDVHAALNGINNAILEGTLDLNAIEERCRKVLMVKYLAGLDQENRRNVDIKNLTKDLSKLEDILLNRKLFRESITLIKNDNNVIPLKRLDTLKVASVMIGAVSQDQFQRTLGKYMPIDHFHITEDDLEGNGEGLLELLDDRGYDLIILGVADLSLWPRTDYGVTDYHRSFISEVSSSHKTILSWFGSPYGLGKIDLSHVAAVLLTYQENEWLKDFSAQMIFGGLGTNGRLPVTINENFPAGHGISTKGGLRLAYLLPEEAGLDGNFLRTQIDSIAVYALDMGVAPGLQVLIAKDGKVVFHKAFGYHTYDSLQAVNETDLYDLASVTKITGALPALMRLHDQRRFSLDATLGDYIPDFRRGNKKDIDLRNILSHNAQLKAWIPYWQTTLKNNGKFKSRTLKSDSSATYPIRLTDELFLYKDYRSTIYKMIRKSDLLPEPGYVYSGLSFYLFPEIVEQLTGENYEQHLKNTFYKPLGAASITYNPYKYYELDQIIPTEIDTFFRKIDIHGRVHDEGAAMMDGVSSNAGLFANANDLAKLIQMYLNYGTYGGERYITENTLKEFTFCHYCNEGNRRGLAFDKPVLENKEDGSTAMDASADSFGHSGYTGTFVWADPETGILFLFLSNRVYPTRDNRKLYQLSIRPRMHQVIYDARMK